MIISFSKQSVLLVAIIGYGSSLLLCWGLARIAAKIGLVDHPNSTTKTHSKATPIVGGIALWIIFTIFAISDRFSGIEFTWLAITCMTAVGLIDDLFELSAIWKLILQVVAALVFTIVTNHFPATIGLIVVFWTLLVVNSLNYMDNQNGICGGVSLVLLVGLVLIKSTFISLPMIVLLIGALAGFLTLNFPQGKIFLGDTGTHFLGAIIAYSLVSWTALEGLYHRWIACLIVSVPIIDFVQVTLSRYFRGKPIWKSDPYHLSHLLMKRGLSLPAAAVIIWLVTAATILIAYLFTSGKI